MFSATFYRVRKAAAKKPWMVILIILAVAFSLLMIAVPSMSGGEDGIVRNTSLVIGGINLLYVIMFNFIFFTGLKNGVIGFSNADVNFHLAGPFTQRFNLLIAATGVFKLCIILLWVLCCQSSVLHMSIGLSSFDILAVILGSIPVFAIGYFIAAFIGAYFWESETATKRVRNIVLGIDLIYVLLNAFSLYKTYGSVEAITALGAKGIVAYVGTTIYSKIFPVAGWTNLIYSGMITNDAIYIIAGILLLILSVVLVVILYSRTELNYYEAAMEYAQKVADLNEAKKAGIDSDSAKVTRNIKVGKENFAGGWGASAFTMRHLFENKRAARFFFVNPISLLYRGISAVYMLLIGKGLSISIYGLEEERPFGTIIAGALMMVLLNAVIYGGGKTVLEFNKPFIFMVPEKGSKKLMACLVSEIPEMLFDSLLCSLIMVAFASLNVAEAITFGIMMTVFDMLFELLALVGIRIFRQLGRVLLVMVRYFFGYIVIMTAVVPIVLVNILTGSLAIGFAAGAAYAAVLCAILLLVSKDLVDHVEYGS